MNLSGKGAISGDRKVSTTMITTLNPNAAEFIPSSIKSPSGITTTKEISSKLASSGKDVLDRSQSLASNNSDEEAHNYWHHQLPDDITPDFKETTDGDFLGIDSLSLSSLSLNGNEASQSLPGNGFIRKDHHHHVSPMEKFRYPVSSYGDDLPLASLRHYSSKPLEKQIINNDQLLSRMRDAAPYYQKSRNGFGTTGMMNRLEISDSNPREFLASRFPGFTVETLAEAYFSNGGNLNLTVEMLRQFEADGGLNMNVNSKPFLGSVHSRRGFPALFTEDDQNIQQNVGPLFKPGNSIPSGEAIGFSSAAVKSQDYTGLLWKNEINRSVNGNNVGSSRSSHILASSYQRGMFGDRLQSHGSSRAVPAWLETGEAVGNLYPEIREEARDNARLRNSYIEQERQAYMAKDLSVKGQLHHLHRNPVGLEILSNGIGRVLERTIDLLGMHINEALNVLKHELSVLRNAARSVDQIVHVYICVGSSSGHQNRASSYMMMPPSSRLPIAVQHFLLDEEGLDYSEPQPGVFRVVVY